MCSPFLLGVIGLGSDFQNVLAGNFSLRPRFVPKLLLIFAGATAKNLRHFASPTGPMVWSAALSAVSLPRTMVDVIVCLLAFCFSMVCLSSRLRRVEETLNSKPFLLLAAGARLSLVRFSLFGLLSSLCLHLAG